MNYTWRITKLGLRDELNGDNVLLENAIVRVQWKRIAEDTDGTTATYLGHTDLVASNISASDFTSLNDVTKAQVIAWVEASLTAGQVSRIHKQLESKIERNRLRTITPSW